MRPLFLVLLLSAAAGAQTSSPAAPTPPSAGWARQFDELWYGRGRPGSEKEMHKILNARLAEAPEDIEALCRQSALLNWQADGAHGEIKPALGKAAWQAADRVVAARADDVRGQYNSATGIGLYSEGVGILTALSQGLEGKFRERILAALKLDKDYLDGAPQVVWGRYFFKLPWPKRDVGESVKVLREAVRTHPSNLRARLYLADSLAEDGKRDEARSLVQEIVEAKEGGDPPEDQRIKALAREWLARR